MKILLIMSILCVSCATVPKPSLSNCIEVLKNKFHITEDNPSMMAIVVLCSQAKNDPELALKYAEQISDSH